MKSASRLYQTPEQRLMLGIPSIVNTLNVSQNMRLQRNNPDAGRNCQLYCTYTTSQKVAFNLPLSTRKFLHSPHRHSVDRSCPLDPHNIASAQGRASSRSRRRRYPRRKFPACHRQVHNLPRAGRRCKPALWGTAFGWEPCRHTTDSAVADSVLESARELGSIRKGGRRCRCMSSRRGSRRGGSTRRDACT
jgi:hypothetical protein